NEPTGGENGRVRRNANGDLIPTDTAQSSYCSSCFACLGETGKRVPYEADVGLWVDECGRCRERRLEAEAEHEAARAKLEAGTRARECAREGCDELFTPATVWQAYCTPEHRWAAHRRRSKGARRLRLVS